MFIGFFCMFMRQYNTGDDRRHTGGEEPGEDTHLGIIAIAYAKTQTGEGKTDAGAGATPEKCLGFSRFLIHQVDLFVGLVTSREEASKEVGMFADLYGFGVVDADIGLGYIVAGGDGTILVVLGHEGFFIDQLKLYMVW